MRLGLSGIGGTVSLFQARGCCALSNPFGWVGINVCVCWPCSYMPPVYCNMLPIAFGSGREMKDRGGRLLRAVNDEQASFFCRKTFHLSVPVSSIGVLVYRSYSVLK